MGMHQRPLRASCEWDWAAQSRSARGMDAKCGDAMSPHSPVAVVAYDAGVAPWSP